MGLDCYNNSLESSIITKVFGRYFLNKKRKKDPN